MLLVLRSVYLIFHFIVGCLLGLMICLVRPFHKDNSHYCARVFGWARFVLGVRFIAKNECPTGRGQAIYVCNHQDSLDMFLYPPMLPYNLALLGKHSLMYIPLFGVLFWLAGNIFINRSDKSKARDAMAEAAQAVHRKKCAVFIFPEGTRSRGRGLLPFKHGAFTLAIEAGLPIVPLCFSSTHKNVDLRRWKAGECIGEFLPPVSTEGLTRADAKALAAQVQEQMAEHIARLDARA
ncbi:1-acyl-sn-glycerol-3-phosphate acyltransferase [Thalassolituus sp.]|jgi:1-acyl-sn-glycerol-3-phosphate acyltransferase|uniref:lysophospholipid acyltransferase family protein n=1 Tax=Thalassolituus sp. TaxID=2030822 RepID=UPI00260B0D63|nr:1-acylglycerol-3-phosphate O-acyltransferase [uncultured Thalassolituus sp.]TNC93283.1 MAG: 1-acyl-sn-glycerol-3-phosphate acyltransferase [Thalassolituus sp.]